MMLILGVGNTLLSDDGAGCYIAEAIADIHPAYNGGTAPENFTAPIRRAAPSLLVIVDAAAMGLPAGSIRIIPPEKIDDTSIGTHMLPLSHLIAYLSPDIPEILFIGIEPETIQPGVGLSPVVREAADRLLELLQMGKIRSVERL